MEIEKIKKAINGVVLVIFGLFDVVLLIRILLRIIGASTASSFVKFWYSLSDTFLNPFDGTFTDIGSGKIVLELDSLLAIAIYFLIAIFIVRVVNGLFKEKTQDKTRSLIDSFFKLTEGILGLRFLFKLVGAHLSGFITFLYGISAPVYEPFEGLLPSIGEGNVVFETSTFIAIIIFVILDVATDRILNEVFKGSEAAPGSDATIQPTSQVPHAPKHTEPPAQPSVPTVQVNVPSPAQPTPSPAPQQMQNHSQGSEMRTENQPVQYQQTQTGDAQTYGSDSQVVPKEDPNTQVPSYPQEA